MFLTHRLEVNSREPEILIMKDWLKAFIDEMQLYADQSMEDEPWRYYTERPMLGFLTSGIARADANKQTAILQEFGVHNSGSFLGRCDLFMLNNNNAYLIEAKFDKGAGGDTHWDIECHKNKLRQVEEQLETYYNAEQQAYSFYKNTYLVVLIFYRLTMYSPRAFIKYIKEAKKFTLSIPGEFYSLVTEGKPYTGYSGIEIYGFIKKKEISFHKSSISVDLKDLITPKF